MSTTPEPSFEDLFAPDEPDEQAFQNWYGERAASFDLNPNPDAPEHFYDYRAAFKAGAEPDSTGHWPSEFKREGHPRLVVGGVNTKTGESEGFEDLFAPDEAGPGAGAGPGAPRRSPLNPRVMGSRVLIEGVGELAENVWKGAQGALGAGFEGMMVGFNVYSSIMAGESFTRTKQRFLRPYRDRGLFNDPPNAWMKKLDEFAGVSEAEPLPPGVFDEGGGIFGFRAAFEGVTKLVQDENGTLRQVEEGGAMIPMRSARRYLSEAMMGYPLLLDEAYQWAAQDLALQTSRDPGDVTLGEASRHLRDKLIQKSNEIVNPWIDLLPDWDLEVDRGPVGLATTALLQGFHGKAVETGKINLREHAREVLDRIQGITMLGPEAAEFIGPEPVLVETGVIRGLGRLVPKLVKGIRGMKGKPLRPPIPGAPPVTPTPRPPVEPGPMMGLPPGVGLGEDVIEFVPTPQTQTGMGLQEKLQEGLLQKYAEIPRAEFMKTARTDPVTGTLNRRAFLEDEEIVPAAQYVYADLEGLKFINEKFGHDAGDALIKATGALLKEGPFADNVYRVGGDEFVIRFLDEADQKNWITWMGERTRSLPLLEYGTGTTRQAAELDLKGLRAVKEKAGTRAVRGEEPRQALLSLSKQEVGRPVSPAQPGSAGAMVPEEITQPHHGYLADKYLRAEKVIREGETPLYRHVTAESFSTGEQGMNWTRTDVAGVSKDVPLLLREHGPIRFVTTREELGRRGVKVEKKPHAGFSAQKGFQFTDVEAEETLASALPVEGILKIEIDPSVLAEVNKRDVTDPWRSAFMERMASFEDQGIPVVVKPLFLQTGVREFRPFELGLVP